MGRKRRRFNPHVLSDPFAENDYSYMGDMSIGDGESFNDWYSRIVDSYPNPPPGGHSQLPFYNNSLSTSKKITTKYGGDQSKTETETEEAESEKKLNMAGGRYAGSVKAHNNVFLRRKGAKLVYEDSGHIADYNCVYVGHNSVSISRALYVLCYGVMRALLAHAGYNVNVSNQYMFDINAIFRLGYKNTPVSSNSSNDFLMQVNGTNKTLPDYALALYNQVGARYAASPNAQMDFIMIYPRTDAALVGGTNIGSTQKSINFGTSKVHMQNISTLKVQNVTKHLNTAGTAPDEYATAVDAAPLVGQIYHGPGQGTWSKDIDDQSPFMIDHGGSGGSGLQGRDGYLCGVAAAYEDYQEPPNPDMLVNVTKSSGVKMQPGDLKTSRLVYNTTTNVREMFNRLGRLAIPLEWTDKRLGHFNIMALEKMIGIKGATYTDNPAVEVDFEVNQEWLVYVKAKNEYSTPQYYFKSESVSLSGGDPDPI